MHVTTCLFLLRVIDKRMHIALHRLIAAGGVRGEPTARLHRQVGGLLHRLHREISGRLYHNCPLATDPGDDGWPVFVIMAPTRLTFLAAPTRSTPQRLLPTLRGLPLLASGVGEIIRFDDPFQLTLHFIDLLSATPMIPLICYYINSF